MSEFIYTTYLWLIPPLILLFALLFDLTLGDPELKYHPVQLIGRTINWLKKHLWSGKKTIDRINGFFLIILPFLLFGTFLYLIQIILWSILPFQYFQGNLLFNLIFLSSYCAINGFILKWSFAIKYLGTTTIPIYQALKEKDLEFARKKLSYIVRRNTQELSENYVISASVEVIAESSTDSAISVIWFYLFSNLLGTLIYLYIYPNYLWLFLGIPCAYLFRIINTGDSIVGYKDTENINIGFASAKLDTLSNFLPTRITVLFMFLVGKFYHLDIKNGWKILKEHRNITESINAGWTMSTIAGLLNIELEKQNHYKLGVKNRELIPEDIILSYKLIKNTILLFSFTFLLVISTVITLLQLIF